MLHPNLCDGLSLSPLRDKNLIILFAASSPPPLLVTTPRGNFLPSFAYKIIMRLGRNSRVCLFKLKALGRCILLQLLCFQNPTVVPGNRHLKRRSNSQNLMDGDKTDVLPGGICLLKHVAF